MAIETSRVAIVKQLTREGWELVRHGANHDIFTHPQKTDLIQLPRHRTISVGVARSVAKFAGWR